MNALLTNGAHSLISLFASVYGSGAYDSSTYNGAQSSTSSSSSVLTNTGFDIALIVTVACVLALLAIIVRVWKRPKRSVSS
jgi:hypothetical protein